MSLRTKKIKMAEMEKDYKYFKGFPCKLIEKWEAPKEDGAPLLCMPNIPKPLHGLNPRTIVGEATWKCIREQCVARADFKCEICGKKNKKHLQTHELYSYDFKNGIGKFERCVALCEQCHMRFIHSGRMFTKYKKSFLMKNEIYVGIEHGFALIKKWNDKHDPSDKLRVSPAILDYIDNEDLGDRIWELIDKYEIEFYVIKQEAKWSDWKLIIGDKEYKTLYKDEKEWQEKMKLNNEKQDLIEKRFKRSIR